MMRLLLSLLFFIIRPGRTHPHCGKPGPLIIQVTTGMYYNKTFAGKRQSVRAPGVTPRTPQLKKPSLQMIQAETNFFVSKKK